MKKFEFSLQSVLNLKDQEEQMIQKELARLKAKYQEVKEELDYVRERKGNWTKRLEQESKEGVELATFRKYKKYIEHLDDKIEELKLRLNHWAEKVNECQKELLEKVKERKSLSKLKERRYEEYWQKFLREEQKLNDELAINNFNQ